MSALSEPQLVPVNPGQRAVKLVSMLSENAFNAANTSSQTRLDIHYNFRAAALSKYPISFLFQIIARSSWAQRRIGFVSDTAYLDPRNKTEK